MAAGECWLRARRQRRMTGCFSLDRRCPSACRHEPYCRCSGARSPQRCSHGVVGRHTAFGIDRHTCLSNPPLGMV